MKESYERKSYTARPAPRGGLPDGYHEDEGEIILFYHQTVCTADRRWLPVNRFTEGTRKAIANWLAPYRDTEPRHWGWLFRAVAAGNESVVIPKTRTLARLLYDNPPESLEFSPD